MKKRIYAISCLALVLLLSLPFGGRSQEINIKKIPDPKKICGTCYVSNPDGVLSEIAVSNINAKLQKLESETSAQVAVVVIKGDKTTDARELSMDLFNLWKVGSKGKDNGLILVLAIESRHCFIRTGYGLEGAIPDAKATQIMNQIMFPSFRKGDWDKGISDGVEAISKLAFKEYKENGFNSIAVNSRSDFDIVPYLIIYAALSLVMLLLSVFKISKTLRLFSNNQKEEKLRLLNSKAAKHIALNFIFLPSLLVLLIWIYGYLYTRIRKSVVVCNCGNRMKRLSEKEEDTYLSNKQQLEEALHSKDYDVWICYDCGTTAIYSYNKAITSYSVCPFCGAKTYFQASNSIVSPATALSNGIGRKVFQCKHCGKTQTSDYKIPKSGSGAFVAGSGLGGGHSSGFGGGWGGGFSGGGGGGGHF
ncbi:MAG: TPM domain-containing protein [Bacteroidales bacterium]|jgi:uncharacterized protein|nr:TPM domain-containing protein [Bacteroidales bacterium]